MAYLASLKDISYADFLHVHRILFSEFYPWAGQDRADTAGEIAVRRGDILFCHPQHARLAVTEGLRLAQTPGTMQNKPGEVLGLFAYGHPFLDGNGCTMLLVHSELCHRAGFAISWELTAKDEYLAILGQAIGQPGKGILDAWLKPFITKQMDPAIWEQTMYSLRGLDGLSAENKIEGSVSDPKIIDAYRELEAQRGYRIA
nr:Fic family protein [Massilia sp. BJB1822]